MDGLSACETYVRGGEAAANKLAGVAVSTGHLAPAGQRLPNMAPLLRIVPNGSDADTEERRQLRETTALICRIAGQLSYWVLTDAVPWDKDRDIARFSSGMNKDNHITGAFYASGLASTCSATTRAGEGGSPLLHYAPINVVRMLALIESAGKCLRAIRVTNAAETDALQAVLTWCVNTAKYCKELSSIDESTFSKEERSISPTTMRRLSTVFNDTSIGRGLSPLRDRAVDRSTVSRPLDLSGVSVPTLATTTPSAASPYRPVASSLTSPQRPVTQSRAAASAGVAPLTFTSAASTPVRPATPPPTASTAASLPQYTTPGSSVRPAYGGRTPGGTGSSGFAGVGADTSPSTHRPLPKWAGGGAALPITEERLQHLFRQYDSEGRGYITVHDMRDIWDDSEVACLPQAKRRLEETLANFTPKNGRVGYDEFSVVMYKLFAM